MMLSARTMILRWGKRPSTNSDVCLAEASGATVRALTETPFDEVLRGPGCRDLHLSLISVMIHAGPDFSQNALSCRRKHGVADEGRIAHSPDPARTEKRAELSPLTLSGMKALATWSTTDAGVLADRLDQLVGHETPPGSIPHLTACADLL